MHCEPRLPLQVLALALSVAVSRAGTGTPSNLHYNETPPDTPVLLFPQSNAQNVPSCTLQLEWRASPRASSYECWFWFDSSGVTATDVDTVQDSTRTVTSLRNLTKYFWKVRAMNDSGASGFTAVDSFTTVAAPVAQPKLISPRSGTPDRTPLFVWNVLPCATGYHLQVSTNSSFTEVVRDTLVTDTTLEFAEPFDFSMTYYWRVNSFNAGGMGVYLSAAVFEIVTDVGKPDGFPAEYALHQNFPNPFNPSTAISYQLSAGSLVTLKVFDLLGRKVATLVDAYQWPGFHTVLLDGSGLASGVYVYRLTAGAFVDQKKMLLVR